MSKFSDETDDLMAGYKMLHCEGFTTFLLRSDVSVIDVGGVPKTVSRGPRGRILSNVPLRT